MSIEPESLKHITKYSTNVAKTEVACLSAASSKLLVTVKFRHT